MTPKTRALYDRLQAFRFEEGRSAFPFHHRLARENGWTAGFTARVISEYRRFLLLAMVAGHPVSPSDQVDQAWHLHLLYTRSYWDRLCGQVLGRPLHHEPTEGGREEAVKFGDWYARTLDSYRRIFEVDPPAEIWPDAHTRFGDDMAFVRVNTARHLVTRKFWRRR